MTPCRTLLVVGLAAAVLAAADQAPDEFVLRTYDVRGVLAVGTRYAPTPLGVRERIDAATARGFSPRLAVPLGSAADRPAVTLSAADREMEAELLRLVRDAAGNAGWAPAGEGAATVREGLLCVWQRRSAQARIAGLLARLRRRASHQVIVRAGLYVCSPEAARQVHEGLKVSDLEPVNPLLPEDAPPIKGALLKPDQVAAAVRLLSRTPGSRVLLSATIPCLPVREAAVEDLRLVLFVSDVDRSARDAAILSPTAGVVSAGWEVLLNPVPSADLGRVQLGVRARLAHLAGIEAATRTVPADGDEAAIEGPVHRPTVRSATVDMTLVVPAGEGVLVSGPPVTVGDEWGRAISGQLMGVFWPTVSDAAVSGPVAADDLAALKATLDRPIDLGLEDAPVSDALAELTRLSGLKVEVTARPGVNDGPGLLARRVTFSHRPVTPIEALRALLGDRVEQVALEPPDSIRLTIGQADRPAGADDASDALIGTLAVRSADGRIVTRMNVRRRDLTPEVRASIEVLLSETLRKQGADDPGQ